MQLQHVSLYTLTSYVALMDYLLALFDCKKSADELPEVSEYSLVQHFVLVQIFPTNLLSDSRQ
jgi:hypothetical protein